MAGAGRFGGILAISLSAGPVAAWTPAALFAPCRGDCGIAVYGGPYVDDSLTDLVTDPQSPATWDYRNDFLLAAAISVDVGAAEIDVIEQSFGSGAPVPGSGGADFLISMDSLQALDGRGDLFVSFAFAISFAGEGATDAL